MLHRDEPNQKEMDLLDLSAVYHPSAIVWGRLKSKSLVGKISDRTDWAKLTDKGRWDIGEGLEALDAHIAQNRPFMTSILDVAKLDDDKTQSAVRKHDNCNYAILFATDIDNNIEIKHEYETPEGGKKIVVEKRCKTTEEGYLSIDDALAIPFVKAHALRIFPTNSHKDDHHRYRIVWALHQAITPEMGGAQTIKCVNKLIAQTFKLGTNEYGDTTYKCDKIFNASNAWFGTPKPQDTWYKNDDARLPDDFVFQALEFNEQETSNTPQRKERKSHETSPIKLQVDACLFRRMIDAGVLPTRSPNGESDNHEKCLKVLTGLLNHFDYDMAYDLAEEWLPTGNYEGRYWDNAQRLNSIDPSRVTFATIVFFAKDEQFDASKEYIECVNEIMGEQGCHQFISSLTEEDKESLGISNITINDDILDFDISFPSFTIPNQKENADSEEEKSELRNIEYQIIEDIANDDDSGLLPIDDNYDIFHPELGKRVKMLADSVGCAGTSYATMGAILPVIAAVTPICTTRDYFTSNPSYPTAITIGKSSEGKTPITTTLVMPSINFLESLNDVFQSHIGILEENMKAKDASLRAKAPNLFDSQGNPNLDITDRIAGMFTCSFQSSKEGYREQIGALESCKGIAKEHLPGYFIHPIHYHNDDAGNFLLSFYTGDRKDYAYTRGDLNQMKSAKGFMNCEFKKLSGKKKVRVADLPRAMHLITTPDMIYRCFSTQKRGSDGFTGRFILNLIQNQRKPKTLQEVMEARSADVSEEIQFLIFLAIATAAMTSMKESATASSIEEYTNLSEDSFKVFFDFREEEIKAIQDEISFQYPDWQLTEDYCKKSVNLFYEVAPQIKKFNYYLELGLQLLKKVFPGREIKEFLPLIKLGNSQDLANFARALTINLDSSKLFFDNHSFYNNGIPLDLESIVQPFVVCNESGHIQSFTAHLNVGFMPWLEECGDLRSPTKEIGMDDAKIAADYALHSCKSFGLLLKLFESVCEEKSIIQKAAESEAEIKLLTGTSTIAIEKKLNTLLNDMKAGKSAKAKAISKAILKDRRIACKKGKNDAGHAIYTLDDEFANKLLLVMVKFGYVSEPEDGKNYTR
jgi:hypothetical protein